MEGGLSRWRFHIALLDNATKTSFWSSVLAVSYGGQCPCSVVFCTLC